MIHGDRVVWQFDEELNFGYMDAMRLHIGTVDLETILEEHFAWERDLFHCNFTSSIKLKLIDYYC
jgi:hypothetical protein